MTVVTRVAFAAENLSVENSDGIQIVSNVALDAQPGQIVGLVGETGAGKTLTGRALLGLLPRTLRATGRVRFGETAWMSASEPGEIAKQLGRTTGLMLQDPLGAFDPLQRVGSQLIEAVVKNKVMSRPEAMERAHNLCRHLGLGDPEALFRLYPHQLSGGMAQRVSLALTLMPRLKVLVVDEPTSALDANLRVDALGLLRSLARESQLAMLLISHDLGLVSHFCDSLVVLYAGHVVESGPTAAVLRAPAHPYTRALISCSPTLDRPPRTKLPTVGGEPPRPGFWPTGCSFHPRCPDVQDRCLTDVPGLAIQGDRRVACHYPHVKES